MAPRGRAVPLSRLAQEFNLRQVGINHVSEVREDSTAVDSVYLEVHVDLLQLEGMKGALALEELCRRAGIDTAGGVFVWATPPCETYSVANWSNWSRMLHYMKVL